MKVGATSPNYLPSPISAGDHSKAKGTFRQEAGTKVVNETLYSTKSGRAEVSGGQAEWPHHLWHASSRFIIFIVLFCF